MTDLAASPARLRPALAAALALAALAATPAPARAGVILSIESTTVAAGSKGDSFDVTLTDTGPVAISLSYFTFTLQASNGNVSFDHAASGVTTDTLAPYVFTYDSLFAPNIGSSGGLASAQQVSARDASGFGFDLVGAGATVGLGHFFFDAGPAGGVTLLSFVSDSTNIPGYSNQQLTFDTGTITTQFSATPEPSALAMAGGAALFGGVGWWRRRRRAAVA